MGSSGRHSSHTHIDITHISRSPSPGSQDDELHENGVQVSAGVSPQYSVIQPTQSQSGSSSHPGDFVQVLYPNEVHEGDGSDSASRVDRRERIQQYESRSGSGRREPPRRQQSHRAQARSRTRDLQQDTSPTESGDSTEEFLARRDFDSRMPRPQSYYGQNGYTHSSSSGSYPYPPVPQHAGQVIALQPQPMTMPYQPQYPPAQPMPYPHGGYPGGFNHHAPPSHVSSPYTSSPYGPATIVNYGAPPASSYFPNQYPPPYGGQQYPPHYMQYQQPMPSQLQYPYYPQPLAPSPQPGSASVSAEKLEPKNEEDLVKRLQALMKEEHAAKEADAAERAAEKATIAASLAEQEARFREQALRQAEEKVRQDALRAEEEKRIREQALIQAADNARAEAAAASTRAEEERRIRQDAMRAAEESARAAAAAETERRAQEARIREEARLEAIRSYEEQVRKAAEQVAREQLIRKEAAEAALKAAAEDAAAKADRAAAEKKIADEAAAAAKTAAEQEAAAAAATAKEAAKKAQEEAEAKLKEAEEAAAKAKAEAEEAEKKAAAAAPPEKRAPVRFKDAIGRNYNFPWERCNRWRDMEGLINQAFAHIENLADHVMAGRYDLIGPDKEIIMPNYWESTIEPDMHITMMLWPIPEPKPPPEEEEVIPLPPDIDPDAILNLDEILNPRRERKPKKKKPSGLAGWMLGGGASSRGSRSLKGDKKPDVAAKSQHGATESSACIVM